MALVVVAVTIASETVILVSLAITITTTVLALVMPTLGRHELRYFQMVQMTTDPKHIRHFYKHTY